MAKAETRPVGSVPRSLYLGYRAPSLPLGFLPKWIVGAATVAAGGCLAWEKETKPGGVVPLQFVRRT